MGKLGPLGTYHAFMVTNEIGNEEFCIQLNDLGNLVEGAWCVGEDFNEILYSSERNGVDEWVSEWID